MKAFELGSLEFVVWKFIVVWRPNMIATNPKEC